jgi:hypothetical protein
VKLAALMEELRLGLFVDKALRRIFESKRNDSGGGEKECRMRGLILYILF